MKELIAKKAPSLSKSLRLGEDGSIRTEEGFTYPIEFRLLMKESDKERVLTLFQKVIGPYIKVNDSCGLHVHLDMRNRDKEKAYKSLYKALPYLTSRVDYTRLNNSYCKLNSDNELASFAEALRNGRYQAINPHSYNKHKTLEVRLKESTLNFREASSWVRDLIDIVNDKKKSRRGVSFFNIRNAANTAA